MSLVSQISAFVSAVGGNIKALTGRVAALEAKKGSPLTVVAIVGGVATCDLSLGDYFAIAANSNFTLAFSNLPPANVGRSISVMITQDATGGWVMTLPASFKALGASDTAIQTAAISTTELVAKTVSSGSTWSYSMAKRAA